MLKKVRRPRRAQSRGSNHWHARKRLPREHITALNLLGLCHFVKGRIPSRNHSSPSPRNQQWRKDLFCPCEPDTWLWYEQLTSSHKGESFCSNYSTNSHFWPCRVNSQVSQQGKFQNFVGPFSDYFSAYLVLYWTKTFENLHNNSIAVHWDFHCFSYSKCYFLAISQHLHCLHVYMAFTSTWHICLTSFNLFSSVPSSLWNI